MASCFEKQHTDLEDGPVYSRAILFGTEINEEPQRPTDGFTFSCAILPSSAKNAFPSPSPRLSGITYKSSSFRAIIG